MNKKDLIFVTGHKGMVGSAILRYLKTNNFSNIIIKNRNQLDLRNSIQVKHFFQKYRPEIVILAAAKVGGIKANQTYPVEFLLENLKIQNNIIENAYLYKVKKLVFLGSSCIYPRNCPQPMKEEYLLTGLLEPTNEGYALAKISGLKLLEYYSRQYGFSSLNIMPCNLYGPNDHFDLDNSHVVTALVKKFVDAVRDKETRLVIWSSGKARREFLHVDDFVRALFFLIDKWNSPNIINVGSGQDVTIKILAQLIARKVGFTGQIIWDETMPDGMPRKCLDISKLENLGFSNKITLEKGLDDVINEYKNSKK